MSTTTAAHLLARADSIVRDLTLAVEPVDTARWESLEITVHRLLRECVGPGRAEHGTTSTGVPTSLLHVLRHYPTPLRPPLDTVLSAREAARYLGVSHSTTIQLAVTGAIPAERHAGRYAIPSSALDHRTDITPADAADPHPLARLATTFGVLADLMAGQRRTSGTLPLTEDETRATLVRVLSYTAIAARYTLGHAPLTTAARALSVAQYCQSTIDALGAPDPVPGLHRLTATSLTPSPPGPDLEDALHAWLQASHLELARSIPSSQVIGNIANHGAHLYAVLHHALTGDHSPDHHPTTSQAAAQSVAQAATIREAAHALRTSDQAWKAVTTLQRPGHEYLTTARALIAAMPSPSNPQADPDQALTALAHAHRALTDLTVRSHDVARTCNRAGLLFAPARTLPPTTDRLQDRSRGTYVALTEREGHTLRHATHNAADHVQRVEREVLPALTRHLRPELPGPELRPFG